MGLNYRGKVLANSHWLCECCDHDGQGARRASGCSEAARLPGAARCMASVTSTSGSGPQFFWTTFILSDRNCNKTFCYVGARTGQQWNLASPRCPWTRQGMGSCLQGSLTLSASDGRAFPPQSWGEFSLHAQAEMACCVTLHLLFFGYTIWTTFGEDWSETSRQPLLWHIGAGGGWRCFWPKGRAFSPGSHSLSPSPLPRAAVTWNR